MGVRFYGSMGERVVAETIQGQRLEVQGVPQESPNSPIGPLKTVAKVRDSGVPYSFESFDLTRPRQRPTLNPFVTLDSEQKLSLANIPGESDQTAPSQANELQGGDDARQEESEAAR